MDKADIDGDFGSLSTSSAAQCVTSGDVFWCPFCWHLWQYYHQELQEMELGALFLVLFFLLSCLVFLYAIVSASAIHPNPTLWLQSDCFYPWEMPRKQFLFSRTIVDGLKFVIA